jgi:hypothetical protein
MREQYFNRLHTSIIDSPLEFIYVASWVYKSGLFGVGAP